MLENAGFFPADIRSNERLEYIHLLDSAVNSYKLAEGNLDSGSLQKVNHVYDALKNPELSEKEREYCKSLAFDIGKKKMTKELSEFYNFVALKVRDRLREESERLYKRRRLSK